MGGPWGHKLAEGYGPSNTLVIAMAGVNAESAEEHLGEERFDDLLRQFGLYVMYVEYPKFFFDGARVAASIRKRIRKDPRLKGITRITTVGASLGALIGFEDLSREQLLLAIDPPGGVDSISGKLNRLFVRCFAAALTPFMQLAGQLHYINKIGKNPERAKARLQDIKLFHIRCSSSQNEVLEDGAAAATAWWRSVAPEGSSFVEMPEGLHCDFAHYLDAYRLLIERGLRELASKLDIRQKTCCI
jgi:hypothetical protein